jgi:hypothetical protein
MRVMPALSAVLTTCVLLLLLLLQVPPVVTHAKLGTLYEEPCIVYIKVGEQKGSRCRYQL